MTNYISFPGLGIDTFAINREAFSIFGKSIYWYGIIICVGIILAVLYVCFRGKHEGISVDDVLDYALFTVPTAIICARLYYVLTSLDDFHSFYDVIAIWNGGIAIYGAIIGGFLAIVCVSKYKKIKLTKMLDATAPAVMIGQILGRWGNFFNAEAYGDITKIDLLGHEFSTPHFAKDFLLRMCISHRDPSVPGTEVLTVHPTFLYESVWNLCGFILINLYYRKKKFDGEIVLMYFAWYGFGRFFIEGLRTDSLYVGGIRISQLLGLIFFVGCTAAILVIRFAKKKKQAIASEE